MKARRNTHGATARGPLDPVLAELLDLARAQANGHLPQRLQELRGALASETDPLRRRLARAELRRGLENLGLGADEAAGFADAVLDRGDQETGRAAHAADDAGREIDATDLELPRVSKRAWDLLLKANDPPRLFTVGSVPSRLEQNDDGTPPTLRPLNEDRMRFELARAADWRGAPVKKTGERRSALPPLHVVRDMLATPGNPLPPLTRIVGAPVFDADGRLCEAAGYHPSARLYHAPAADFLVPRVPERPSDDDVREAKRWLCDELLAEFPFVSPAEKAHALAFGLQQFIREKIDGPTPMLLIEKPAPGTGASLLAQALTLPALGHAAPAMTASREEEEWRKRITANLLGGASIVLIDNVRRDLESAALSAAITATVWKDRRMGASEMVEVPVRCGWLVTANNAGLSNELTRRTVRCRLDAQMDRPWEGRRFKHAFPQWIAEHRAQLVWASLTLIRAWFAAGCPAGTKSLGGFESYARVLGGILETVNLQGFLENTAEFYELSDVEGAENRRLVVAWSTKYGETEVGVKELFELAMDDTVALPLSGSDRAQRTQLGRRLAGLRDRRFALPAASGSPAMVVQVTPAGKEHSAARWRLVAVPTRFPGSLPSPGSPETGGTATETGEGGERGEPGNRPETAHGEACICERCVPPGQAETSFPGEV